MTVYEKSFTTLTSDEIKAIIADVVSGDTSTAANSFISEINKNGVPSKRYALTKTKYPMITPTLNSMAVDFETLENKVGLELKNMYSVLGDINNQELKDKFNVFGKTVIELIIELKTKMDEIYDMALDDYEDEFIVPAAEEGQPHQTVFHLTHKPIGKIRLYIDGFRYFKSCYIFNKDDNTITWTNTEENGGFDIDDACVIIEYDYIKQPENINNLIQGE